MATTESLDQRLTVAVFEAVAQAGTVVDRLLDGGLPRTTLGMLMTDRTAERHFAPPNADRAQAAQAAYSPHFLQLARSLAPIGGLGMSGSGLLGVGSLPAALVSAGLGSAGGLQQALVNLGVDAVHAEEVARRVKNGAVLLSAAPEGSTDAVRSTPLLRHEAALSVQLNLSASSRAPTLITPPEAPLGEQRAGYAPLVQSPDEPIGTTGSVDEIGLRTG
jgi:hypothetical protein